MIANAIGITGAIEWPKRAGGDNQYHSTGGQQTLTGESNEVSSGNDDVIFFAKVK